MKTELNAAFKAGDQEVDLFQKMSIILSNDYKVGFIQETHQCYVYYDSPCIRTEVQKEISDLWIIAYSPKKGKARMTFLQAKFDKKLNNTNRTFRGDYFQYELLSLRPMLTKTAKKIKFPLDILSFSCCSSLGSYGVFYLDSRKQIELAYSSASYLIPQGSLPKSTKKKSRSFKFLSCFSLHGVCPCGICHELVSCFDIETFTDSLLNLEIGAEFLHHRSIVAFLRTLLTSQNSDVTTDFLNFLNDLGNTNEGNEINQEGFPINLFLINTDEKREKVAG